MAVVQLLRSVERDGHQVAGDDGDAVGAIRDDRRVFEQGHRLHHEVLANHRFATHEEHRLDVVPVAQRFKLMKHGRVVHLVLGLVRVVGAEDEAVRAREVADVRDVDERGGVLDIAKIRGLAERDVDFSRHGWPRRVVLRRF